MPTYERSGGCCCGSTDCNDIVGLATANPQILTISGSTCDVQCETGSWNQVMEFQFRSSNTWFWDVLPQFVTFGNGIPDPGHIDNCKFCEWVNGFGFTQQYFTGLQISLQCLGSGEDSGKWQIALNTYRRGDESRGNCDEANDLPNSNNIFLTVDDIVVDENGYLVGGPYTITLPEIIFPNNNNSSGNGADFISSECTIDLTFGP